MYALLAIKTFAGAIMCIYLLLLLDYITSQLIKIIFLKNYIFNTNENEIFFTDSSACMHREQQFESSICITGCLSFSYIRQHH